MAARLTRLAVALALTVAHGASACISVNGYRDAEPVRAGTVTAVMGAGAYVLSTPRSAGLFQTGDDGQIIPAPISAAGLRWGLASGLDLGAVVGPAQVRLDATVRLLEAGPLVLSVSPAVTAGYVDVQTFSDAFVPFYTADASVLATAVLHPRVRLTVFAGPGAGLIPAQPNDGLPEDQTGFLVRQGGGVRVWVNDVFALHPEVVVTTDAGRGYNLVDVALGFGFILAPAELGRGAASSSRSAELSPNES